MNTGMVTVIHYYLKIFLLLKYSFYLKAVQAKLLKVPHFITLQTKVRKIITFSLKVSDFNSIGFEEIFIFVAPLCTIFLLLLQVLLHSFLSLKLAFSDEEAHHFFVSTYPPS
jgi:hypothetical protein